jgi:serine/threonine-protein kinase
MAPVFDMFGRNESGNDVATAGGGMTGQWLGDYQLEGLLGVGGMAEVYQARDAVINREVAVKVLPPALAADPNYVERFRNEAQAVGALNHPNIVPIHTFGEQGPYLYLVMPLMKESLRDRLLRSAPLPIAEAVQIAVQILSGLGAAHAQGVVHRDVKPENILLDENGVAKLTDFGIARRITIQRASGGPTLAGTGLPVGTPQYMAPEQLRGEDLDQRADIYALGSVLYELLTGLPPFIADTPYQVASLVLTSTVAPPSERNHEIWPELEQAMLRALNRKPADRYANAASFAEALQDALLAHEIELLEPASAVKPSYVKFRSSKPLPRSGDGSQAEQGGVHADGSPAEPTAPPTIPLSGEPPGGKPPRWPPANRPRDDGAGSGGAGRRTLIIALIAAVVLLATCGAGIVSLNLLNRGGTTLAQGTATATRSDLPTDTLAPTNTTDPDTPSPTFAPTDTTKPAPTNTHTPTPTNTPVPPPSLLVTPLSANYPCSGSVNATLMVKNTGGGALNWTATSTDVPPAPLSGGPLNAGQSTPVSVNGTPTGSTFDVTFTSNGGSQIVHFACV